MLNSLKSKFIAIGGLGVALIALNQEKTVQDIQKSPESCAHDGDGRLVSTKDGVNYTHMNNLRLIEAKGGDTTLNRDGQLTVASAGEMIENKDLIEDKVWEEGKVSALFSSVQTCNNPVTGGAIRYTEKLPANAKITRTVNFDF